MKAVSAYTCDGYSANTDRTTTMIVDENGQHYPFITGYTSSIYVGKDMSIFQPAKTDKLHNLTNIQPVELPEAKS